MDAREERADPAILIEQERLGRSASALLADPTIAKFFQVVESAIVSGWANTPSNDVISLQHWRLMLEAHRRYRQVFDEFIEQGTVARLKLEEMSKLDQVKQFATSRFRRLVPKKN